MTLEKKERPQSVDDFLRLLPQSSQTISNGQVGLQGAVKSGQATEETVLNSGAETTKKEIEDAWESYKWKHYKLRTILVGILTVFWFLLSCALGVVLACLYLLWNPINLDGLLFDYINGIIMMGCLLGGVILGFLGISRFIHLYVVERPLFKRILKKFIQENYPASGFSEDDFLSFSN